MFKSVSSKVDFPELERSIISGWDKSGLLEKYLGQNINSKKRFSFIDGPLTANNPMGVHHAWGRTYKDLWQRFFNMKGYKQRFQNGFDEQGLWVEVEVEKELKLKNKHDIENLVEGNKFESIAKFVNLCKERVHKFSKIQSDQSERLGYFMDWDHSYHTSSEQNNFAIWHYLKNIHDRGWLYKGRDTVPWCPRCGTAISQHEILSEEYKEITHKSVYFKLPLKTEDFGRSYLLVWTTTPWTIPGNVAVAIHPKKNYVITEDNLIVIQDRIKALGQKSKKVIKGKDLIGQVYVAPFDTFDRVESTLSGFSHKVIEAEELVTDEEGTGLVHIAPGAGEEDFKLSKEQNLPVIELIDEEAVYLEGVGEFSGKNAKKHPEIIIDYLKNKEGGKFFFKDENYKHRYPTCWRCKTELVWRVVDEWYISMDRKDSKGGETYRDMMKKVIKEINWIPKWGYDREFDWLRNMQDWLISKKRYWGLALPIWECTSCGNFDVIGSKEELEKRSVEGWSKFKGNSPHRPWVDEIKIKCSKCREKTSRIPDVGNPWLDAGIVPYSTLKYFEDKNYWGDWFPADFITESFPGQFKNWFYSLIAMSTALEGKAPFKTLLGHGAVRDEKGEEMHKSKGNAIWFDDAAEKMGVDVMRWVYLRTNPEHNVNFGFHVADETRRRFILILWNVYVFFVTYANLDKWATGETEKSELSDPLDRWIISQLNILVKEVNTHLEKFEPDLASRKIEEFVLELSTWYVRRIRGRVGPTVSDSDSKNNTYQILYSTLTVLSKLMAPFMPFISEEIYTNLTGEPSVHLAEFPLSDERVIDKDLATDMRKLRGLVEDGHSLRKENKIKVRQPLSKFIYGKGMKKLSLDLENLLMEELNVKRVEYDKNKTPRFNLRLTNGLREEGEAREIIRQIQRKRKEANCEMDEEVTVQLPSWPKRFEEYIKKETLSKVLIKAVEVKIMKK